MAITELNEEKQGQVCDLFDNLQQINKKNNDITNLLDKMVKKIEEK